MKKLLRHLPIKMTQKVAAQFVQWVEANERMRRYNMCREAALSGRQHLSYIAINQRFCNELQCSALYLTSSKRLRNNKESL